MNLLPFAALPGISSSNDLKLLGHCAQPTRMLDRHECSAPPCSPNGGTSHTYAVELAVARSYRVVQVAWTILSRGAATPLSHDLFLCFSERSEESWCSFARGRAPCLQSAAWEQNTLPGQLGGIALQKILQPWCAEELQSSPRCMPAASRAPHG